MPKARLELASFRTALSTLRVYQFHHSGRCLALIPFGAGTRLVLPEGFEPTRLSALRSKRSVSTSSTTEAYMAHLGIEPS